MEDNIAAGGAIRHLRFCKTYEEVPDKYIRYAAAGRWEYPKQVTHWTRIKSRTKKIRTEIRIEIKIGKNNDK